MPIHSAKQLEKSRVWNKETYYQCREDLYKIVGSACVGCGHADIRVIEFDHVNDDGAQDRLKFKGARSALMYYVAHPEEAISRLQPLCRNCNWLKRKGHALPNSPEAL